MFPPLSIFCNLLSAFCTIKLSTYLFYLLHLKNITPTESRPQRNGSYRIVLFSKCFYYFLVAQYMIRFFTISRLLASGSTLQEHSPFIAPALSLFHHQYAASFNFFTISSATLTGFFLLTLDYSLSFGLDFILVKLIHELVCINSEQFWVLNSHLEVPEISLRNCWKNLTKGRHFFRQLWNPTCQIQFAHTQLDHFPNLSQRIRSRLVLLSFLYEYATVAIMLLAGKAGF